MARNVSIVEHEDGTASVYIKPQYVEYTFDSFDEALDGLSSLPEIN
jgi:hypothetical protein